MFSRRLPRLQMDDDKVGNVASKGATQPSKWEGFKVNFHANRVDAAQARNMFNDKRGL